MPAFSSVVLDVDSTVTGIEGIDWLAARRGEQIAERVSLLTQRVMSGDVPLEQVYGERLRLIQPSRADLEALSGAYVDALAPNVGDALRQLREAGLRLVLVSGGIRQAVLPTARWLGFDGGDLHAVTLNFSAAGAYGGYESRSPLVRQAGKAEIIKKLLKERRLVRPVLAVGDGSTDVCMRMAADAFAAYTGFVRREAVVAAADREVKGFNEVVRLALTG